MERLQRDRVSVSGFITATIGAKEALNTALLMTEITKSFPGIRANDRVTLEVKSGEIHALLGENGAGKTTLMNILYGIHQPDHGRIQVFGKNVNMGSPKDAIRLGIGMVHQHFMLVDRLSVLENIVLGTRVARWPLLDLDRARERVMKLSAQFHFHIDLDAKVFELPVGMQQRVEIVKSLFRGARLLILDEPTSVLTPQETYELIKILKKLSKKGLTIVFISHKLEEVIALCDLVTVLRRGRVVSTVKAKDVDKATLAKMMVGREVVFRTGSRAPARPRVILHAEKLTAANDRGLHALRDVSFKIHEGEIFGIAGVDGNGQAELAETIAGLRRPLEGTIKLREIDVTCLDALERMQAGIGYVPEDRQRKGLVMGFRVWENAILKEAATSRFSYGGIYFKFKQIKDSVRSMIHFFDIRGPGEEAPVKNLSGGNQQKIVLGREFGLKPALLIAAQPTRGLDVGAVEFVHGQILAFAEHGNAVLLISTELEEIFALSHRFAIIYEGELAGVIENGNEIDVEEIGLMMAGSKRIYGESE